MVSFIYVQSCRLSGLEKRGYGKGDRSTDLRLELADKKSTFLVCFYGQVQAYRSTTDLHYSIYADIVPTLMNIVSYGVLRYGCVG